MNSPNKSPLLNQKHHIKRRGPFYEVWSRLRVQPLAMITLSVIVIIVLFAVFADIIADYDQVALKQVPENKLLSPCKEHIFGTDNFGRDMFARIIHGARIVFLVSISSCIIGIIVAIILACCASLFGGKVDIIIMRVIDILSSIPSMIISIAICAGLGNGIWQLIVALAISSIAFFTRMIRSKSITIVNMEYIESAFALGASIPHVIVSHLVPNLLSIILINGTSQLSINITMCATLSFIGLGIEAPRPEWGLMLSDGITYMSRAPHMVIVPGIAIVLTCLSINTFGDFLRDAFDPQLKGRV